jgi:hypothetical protein
MRFLLVGGNGPTRKQKKLIGTYLSSEGSGSVTVVVSRTGRVSVSGQGLRE